MSFYSKLMSVFGAKASEARMITSMQRTGQPITSTANFESFAHKGYSNNAIVYTAISKITQAAKAVDWVLYQKNTRGQKTELESHPLLDLWHKPNPLQSQSSFIESVIGFKKIAGNSYIEANRPNPNRPPLELWPVRPDKMQIIPSKLGYPMAFRFYYGGQEKVWPVDQINLQSDILHLKDFAPIDDWYGLSPIQAALLNLDQYNHANRWNLALLQNEARPSGVLQMAVTKDNPRGSLTDTQYQQLKSHLDERSGAWNAGRPMILQGGLEWKQMSLSPKDMDFLQSKNTSANDILMVYGVPGELVGLGKTTFTNYAEARLAFYEETVLPTLDDFRDGINNWLTPMFGDNLWLDYDADSIEALVQKREQKYTSLQSVGFLTENEKREAVGYEPIDGFDVIRAGSFLIPVSELGEDSIRIRSDRQNAEPEDEKQNAIPTGDPSQELDFKSINLLNDREKRNSWRQQERTKQRLERPFRKELKKDFDALIEALEDSAKKLGTTQDKKRIEYALLKETDKWAEEKITPTLKKHIKLTMDTFGRNVLRDGKSHGFTIQTKNRSWFDSFVLLFVEQQTATNITTIKNTSQKKIKRVVSEWVAESIVEGDTTIQLSNFIQKEFKGLSVSNADRIARTEVGIASNNGLRAAAESLDIPNMKKEWIAAEDERTRESHIAMNGDRIDANEKFIVPTKDGSPDEMEGPGDTSASPGNFINCRCGMTFSGGN